MRTTIDVDDGLMARALQADLKLLARKVTYQEILKWEGKLRWDGDSDEGSSRMHNRHED